jgi:hypothetical protein
MRRLYRVVAKYDTLLELDESVEHDDTDIVDIIHRNTEEVPVVTCTEIKSLSQKLPPGWNKNCIPWNSEYEETVEDFLKEIRLRERDEELRKNIRSKLTAEELKLITFT